LPSSTRAARARRSTSKCSTRCAARSSRACSRSAANCRPRKFSPHDSASAATPCAKPCASVGQKWLRIEGLRFADGDAVPLCRTVVYVHADYAGVGRLVGRRKSAIYELIEDLYAEKIGDVEQTFRAYVAPAVVARELEVESGTVVVEIKRVYRTTSKKIAEVAVNQFAFNRFTFAMRLRRAV